MWPTSGAAAVLETLKLGWSRFSLARQFMLASLAILVSGMLVIGWWVGEQIEAGVLNRTAAITALYVDTFVSPLVQLMERSGALPAQQIRELDRLMDTTTLGDRIVAIKVWSARGEILYSNNAAVRGRSYPVSRGLQRALLGEVVTSISDLQEPENELERARWSRLLETYAPVRRSGSDEVVAAVEFYQSLEGLGGEILAARLKSWGVVGACTVVMYLLLSGMVGRGSMLIARQQRELREKVAQLTLLLAEKQRLQARIQRAAGGTTALNEQLLRRISADLHDGPAQDVGLALLRLDSLTERCEACPLPSSDATHPREDLRRIAFALQSALDELRTIAAGLRLPALDELPLAEVVARAVQDYQRKSGTPVALDTRDGQVATPLSVKITLYRLLQEALTNAYRHGGGVGVEARVWPEGQTVWVEVRDAGPGFDPQMPRSATAHLGLVSLRERIELLGGSFAIESQPGRGTVVRASLPLDAGVEPDE